MLSDRAAGVKPRVPAVGTPATTTAPRPLQPLRARALVCAPTPRWSGGYSAGCSYVSSVPPQAERASALRKNRICPTTPSRRELLEQQVEELVPALLRFDNLSIFEFLNYLVEYGTPEEVLDLLFAK